MLTTAFVMLGFHTLGLLRHLVADEDSNARVAALLVLAPALYGVWGVARALGWV